MRKSFESATRGQYQIVGRLFNKSMTHQAKDFGDDPYYEWHSIEPRVSAGGGFFPYDDRDVRKNDRTPKDQKQILSSQEAYNKANGTDYFPLDQNRDPPHSKHQDALLPIHRSEDRELSANSTSSDRRNRRKRGKAKRGYARSKKRSRQRSLTETSHLRPPLLPSYRRMHRSPIKRTHPHNDLPSAMATTRRRKKQQNRVEFMGSTHLIMKTDEIDTIVCCEFLDLVEVKFIPPFTEYSIDELEKLWYNKDDIHQMKHEFFVRKRGTSGRNHGQHHHRHQSCLSPALAPSFSYVLSRGGRTQNLKFLRHRKTIGALLCEQEKQRKMSFLIYGRSFDRFGRRCSNGVLDPERLRWVYTTVGKTEQRRKEALDRAGVTASAVFRDNPTHKNEETDIAPRHRYNISDGSATTDTTTSTTTAIILSISVTEDHHNNDDYTSSKSRNDYALIEEYLPISAPVIGHNASTTFGDCIGCICLSLFAPFFQWRSEPLFMEIGDEILVA